MDIRSSLKRFLSARGKPTVKERIAEKVLAGEEPSFDDLLEQAVEGKVSRQSLATVGQVVTELECDLVTEFANDASDYPLLLSYQMRFKALEWLVNEFAKRAEEGEQANTALMRGGTKTDGEGLPESE